MRVEVARIAADSCALFGLDLQWACVDRPTPLDALTERQAAELRYLRGTPRESAWKLGRVALRHLADLLASNAAPHENEAARIDLETLPFPNPVCSLTHTDAVAIAAGCKANGTSPLAGIGVDLETRPHMQPAAARFFLTGAEREALQCDPCDEVPAAAVAFPKDPTAYRGSLVRLWTTKEAIFKADPANDGRLLSQYELADPTATQGLANGPDGRCYRYASWRFASGFVSLAVTRQEAG